MDGRPSDNVKGSSPCWTGWRQPAYPNWPDGFDCEFNRGVCRDRRRARRQFRTLGRPASRFAPAHGSVHNVRRGCLRVQNGSCVSHDVAAVVSSLPPMNTVVAATERAGYEKLWPPKKSYRLYSPLNAWRFTQDIERAGIFTSEPTISIARNSKSPPHFSSFSMLEVSEAEHPLMVSLLVHHVP